MPHGPHQKWKAQHAKRRKGRDLVFEAGGEPIVEHLLVEDRGDAARHGGHNPHPVGGAAPSTAVLIFHVLDEGFSGRVVVHDGHLVALVEGKGQGYQEGR